MSTPRISRGPMAAEVLGRDFTQVSNQLWRDPRIHAKSKGVFGFLASHRDGFGVSPESIAAAMADGVSAVKGALRELEQYGYLTRSQIRRADGLMGDTTYRITDMPNSEPVDENRPPVPTSEDAKNRRSEPVDGNPPADEPPAVNRPHKKTIPSQKISSEEKTTTTTSPPEPTEPPAAPESTEGGGGGSDLRSIAEHITARLDYQGQVPDKRLRKKITDRLITALDAGWTVDGLALYLDLGDAPVNSAAAVYAARLAPDRLPDPEPVTVPASRGGIFAPLPTGAEIEALELDDVFGPARRDAAHEGIWEEATARARQRMGVGYRPFECPPASAYTARGFGSGGGTDARVAGWANLTRELARREHQPYSNPTDDSVYDEPWTIPAPSRPPWCGDPECCETDRMRDVEDAAGFKSAKPCEKCHPDRARAA